MPFMAKILRNIQKKCESCNKKTLHTLSIVKKGKASALSKINRIKSKKRTTCNQGKFSKVPASKIKSSKRPHILSICSQCKRKSNVI